MGINVLVINPGSTSTKVSLYKDMNECVTETIRHTKEELAKFSKIIDQKEYRKKVIEDFIYRNGVSLNQLTAVAGRGGLLKPIPGGTYKVNKDMLEDLISEKFNTHASNLGAILAYDIAERAGINAYIVDPVVVDELEPIARLSGLKGIERRSVAHALNQKAVARKRLSEQGKKYEESAVIVAHIGGGVSVAAHKNGKMVEVVNGLDGEGPFTPERTGALPLYDFAKQVIHEKLTEEQVKKIIAGEGGVKSYLDEIDLRNVLSRIEKGDREAELVLKAMCYQIAKSIGEMAVVLKGKIDMIILTGGPIYSDWIVREIKEYIDWIGPVSTVAGEMEMEALYEGVMRVLNEVEEAQVYTRTS